MKFDDGDQGWLNLCSRSFYLLHPEEEGDDRDEATKEEEPGEEEIEEPINEAQPSPVEDQGSSIALAIAAINSYGVCKEETWDYKVLPGGKIESVNDPPHKEAYGEAKNLKNSSAFRWDEAEEVQCLIENLF